MVVEPKWWQAAVDRVVGIGQEGAELDPLCVGWSVVCRLVGWRGTSRLVVGLVGCSFVCLFVCLLGAVSLQTVSTSHALGKYPILKTTIITPQTKVFDFFATQQPACRLSFVFELFVEFYVILILVHVHVHTVY